MNDETRQQDPQDDNEKRFKELYKEHHPFLYRLLRIKIGSSEAEDVAQEAWRRVHKWLKDHCEPDEVRSWLVAITLNEARRHFQKNGQPHVSLDKLDNPDLEPASDPWPDFIQEADLERILRPLTDNHREVVVMHLIQGYSLKEIAQMKGIKEETVRKRWSRAEKKLYKILDRYMNPE